MTYVDPDELEEAWKRRARGPLPPRRSSSGACSPTPRPTASQGAAPPPRPPTPWPTCSSCPNPSVDEVLTDVVAPVAGRRRRRTAGVLSGPSRHPEMSVRSAITLALDDALASDGRVVLLGEDISDNGVFGVTKGLAAKYGADRVRDTPISEQAIVGAAIGAALGGLRPVAEIMFMDFLGLCLDQLANHAAKLRYMSGGLTPVPMVMRTAVGGRAAGGRPALPDARGLAHPRPGTQGGRPEHAVGCPRRCWRRASPTTTRASSSSRSSCCRARGRSTTTPSRSAWPTSSAPAPT